MGQIERGGGNGGEPARSPLALVELRAIIGGEHIEQCSLIRSSWSACCVSLPFRDGAKVPAQILTR